MEVVDIDQKNIYIFKNGEHIQKNYRGFEPVYLI